MNTKFYEIKNGELLDEQNDTMEDTTNPAASYLFVSTLFDGITPLTTKDDKIVAMKAYLSSVRKNDKEGYKKLLNNLMHSVLYANEIDDLCNPDKSDSFYSTLFTKYKSDKKEEFNKSLLDNSYEYIATLVRIIINEYVEFVFDTVDEEKMKGKGPFAVLRVNKKSIVSQYDKTRLSKDDKLSKYLTSVFYNNCGNYIPVENNVHLCPSCPWKRVTDCPKVEYSADGITLDDKRLRDIIIDGKQLVKIVEDELGNEKTVTEEILITKCRLHDSFVNRRKIRAKSEELLLEKKKNSK